MQPRSFLPSRLRILQATAVCLALLLLYAVSNALYPEKVLKLTEVLPPTALKEIPKNLSGLTWNAESGTLFAVANDPEYAFELSTDGHILRSIRLRGFEDTEGIAHIGGTLFAVVEERRGILSIFDIPARATEIGHDVARQLDLGQTPEKNKGFESLGYDPAGRTIFTMREGKPFVRLDITLDEELRPGTVRTRPLPALKVKDVAAIEFTPNGHLWVLSEASARIVELGPDGEALRTFGLDIDRKRFQPEGMTLGPDGTIYVAGEPNILAVYRTPGN